ncbi:hypothetical protein EZV62_017389 [Acer yangbiense]|uniref:Uncharacterized protein n=1 Tax=Acer yangbiense TaxID=1000413 RepID=A0A5C7HIS7_9ROSI|nr:hypothetical protein EZV62_017389 [Acer yangbiense]
MGNCVSSVYKSSTDMKVAVQIESSSIENNNNNNNNNNNTDKTEQQIAAGDGLLSQTSAVGGHVASFRHLSSREDLFFDSQPWLDSDCEDYFSVNGDLTPSCGNTPIHHKSCIDATDQPEKILYIDSASNCIPELEPSSTDVKKQLIELFQESFRDGATSETKPTIADYLPSKPTSPYESVPNSVCSDGTPGYGVSRHKKDKSAQSSPCCIPGLIRNLSFADRKKRLSSMNTCGL